MAFPPISSASSEFINSLENFLSGFRANYDSEPAFITRAPGRVNIIGEHIDYCGYAVLPMAIEQHILIATSTNSSNQINISNANSQFSSHCCDIKGLKIVNDEPRWYNYILCGVLGIYQHFTLQDPVGMCFHVDGTIPPSAGLSSSSALVCAAALATLHANGLNMSKKDLAALCAHSEHFIGTQGGGMDQAIAFLAKSGTAELIEFNPIRTHEVNLPKGASFVIANSCADINKAATSDFNTRVVECRLAAQILAKKNGLDWKKCSKLSQLQESLKFKLPEMVSMVENVFHKDPYLRSEICDLLEATDEELMQHSLSSNTKHLEKFKLFQRAYHVFTEANRVWEFKRICDEAPDDILKKLGKLMNASHSSCRDLYECSHMNLDELVEIAVSAGALGSRLTGAGWGGCSVSLVPAEKVPSFLKTVKKLFYEKNEDRLKYTESCIFPTQPGSGVAIYQLD